MIRVVRIRVEVESVLESRRSSSSSEINELAVELSVRSACGATETANDERRSPNLVRPSHPIPPRFASEVSFLPILHLHHKREQLLSIPKLARLVERFATFKVENENRCLSRGIRVDEKLKRTSRQDRVIRFPVRVMELCDFGEGGEVWRWDEEKTL